MPLSLLKKPSLSIDPSGLWKYCGGLSERKVNWGARRAAASRLDGGPPASVKVVLLRSTNRFATPVAPRVMLLLMRIPAKLPIVGSRPDDEGKAGLEGLPQTVHVSPLAPSGSL